MPRAEWLLGQLHAGALVFAAWVARNESRFPEAVYYCSSDMSEEQLGRADHEQLLGALQSLTSQHLLGQLCGLAPEQVATSSAATRSAYSGCWKAQGSAWMGPSWLTYVLTAGHKVVVKQLVGGGLARATFCSEAWGAAFDDKMYIARTTWPPGAMSMELPAGHLGWWEPNPHALRAHYRGFERDAYWHFLVCIAALGQTPPPAATAYTLRLEQRLGQPPRMTCTCSSFSVVGAAVSSCLHTAYVSSVEWLLEAGPPPPRLVPAARFPHVRAFNYPLHLPAD
eukprot:XP_001701849.1 predicted protein [Chlamydomonas reinhardtii]